MAIDTDIKPAINEKNPYMVDQLDESNRVTLQKKDYISPIVSNLVMFCSIFFALIKAFLRIHLIHIF